MQSYKYIFQLFINQNYTSALCMMYSVALSQCIEKPPFALIVAAKPFHLSTSVARPVAAVCALSSLNLCSSSVLMEIIYKIEIPSLSTESDGIHVL